MRLGKGGILLPAACKCLLKTVKHNKKLNF